jgi:hypothetical protein
MVEQLISQRNQSFEISIKIFDSFLLYVTNFKDNGFHMVYTKTGCIFKIILRYLFLFKMQNQDKANAPQCTYVVIRNWPKIKYTVHVIAQQILLLNSLSNIIQSTVEK